MQQKTIDEPESESQPAFENDPGSWIPTVIAALMVVALALWFGSGATNPLEETSPSGQDADDARVVVAVRSSTAQAVPLVFAAEGQALPDQDAIIFAETTGDIDAVFVAKGDEVTAGAELAQFGADIELAQLKTASTNLESAQRDAANAERLHNSGAITEDRLVAVRAALALAEAQLTQAKDAVTRTSVRSPFPGRLEELHIETGQLVAMGTPVARVVNLDPLTIRVRVPQQSLAQLEVGQIARVRFITGEIREGMVRFLGVSADAETRTFVLEVEVPNPAPAIPAGISAQVIILTGSSNAHFVSPATLALDESGQIGLKAVSGDGTVAFHPVRIMRAEPSGVWVADVPDQLDIITIGQGFVQPGQVVASAPDEQPAPVPTEFGIER